MLIRGEIDSHPDAPFPALNRRLRLGVVGGGRIAATQAIAARLSDRWDVVAGAFSSDPARAKTAAADWFLPEERCYESFTAMARAEAARPDGVEAVMVTTPNHMHFPAAQAFLDAGIDVLCDKPLTNAVGEAEALVARQQETGLVFGVSYVMSCFPMIRQARELVAAGALGTINQIHVEFMQDWMTPESVADAAHVKWRLDPAKSGKTSCVGDIGTHAVHLASFVSHQPLTHLRADFHVCGAPKPLEDTFFAWTRYGESGIPGTVMATRLAPGNRGGLRLRIFGRTPEVEYLRPARSGAEPRAGPRLVAAHRAAGARGSGLPGGHHRSLGQPLHRVCLCGRGAPGPAGRAGGVAGHARRSRWPRRGPLHRGGGALERAGRGTGGSLKVRLVVQGVRPKQPSTGA